MIADEDRAEAERLALLPRDEQRRIIELYRDVARGKGVPAVERKAGLARADALEKLLKLKPKKPGEK
jgi:DNA-binding phage protein